MSRRDSRHGSGMNRPKDPLSGNPSTLEYKGIPVDPLTHLALVRQTQTVGFVIPEWYVRGYPGRENE